MKKIVLGYLSYVTSKNASARLADFYDSLNSLKSLKSKDTDIISVDNSSIEEVKIALKNSGLFSKHFHYSKNHFDVALFYTTMCRACDIGAEYICFLYDDFIIYDSALQDVINFMDQHDDVNCVRIPVYEFNDKQKYDSDITPKSINPDSIRHYNIVTNSKLNWEGPFFVGQQTFYKNNWHYSSRPAVWRTEFFKKMIETQGNRSRILQGFEDWAQPAFEKAGLKTGVLNMGMVKTTPVVRSARGLELESRLEYKIEIDVNELKKDYNFLK